MSDDAAGYLVLALAGRGTRNGAHGGETSANGNMEQWRNRARRVAAWV